MTDIQIENEDFDLTDEEINFCIEVMNFDEKVEEEDEEEELDEVLSVSQRRQKGRQMKRKKSKLSRARKRRSKRKAGPERIKLRARRAARQAVRKRVAGKAGSRYSELSPTKKIAIDKRLKKKKKQIDRLAKRMAPKVRKKERERFKKKRSTKKEGYEEKMARTKNINESFDRFLSRVEKKEKKVRRALREKARENEVPISVVREVYERGFSDFHENGKRTFTESQWAFQRVNSFLTGGKARQLDEDLWEKVEPLKTIMEKFGLEEAIPKVPTDKVVQIFLDTFNSLNKTDVSDHRNLTLVKKGRDKYQLVGEKGDMTIDKNRVNQLTVRSEMKGEWIRDLKKLGPEDIAAILKNAGVEEE